MNGAKHRLFFATQTTHLQRDDSSDNAEIKQSKSNSAFSSNSLSNLKKNLSIDHMVDRLSKVHKSKVAQKNLPSSHMNYEEFSLCNDRPEATRPKLVMKSQHMAMRDKKPADSRKEVPFSKNSPVKALKHSSKQTKSRLA